MNGKILVLLLLPAVCEPQISVTDIRKNISVTALSKVGSTHWSYCSPSGHGKNTNKCNYFVHDVGVEAGAKMPRRTCFFIDCGPVGAGESGWGKACTLKYWCRVNSPKPGDIVAAHKNCVYHVGIYFGNKTTVYARADKIVNTAWPYHPYKYQGIRYWRYQG